MDFPGDMFRPKLPAIDEDAEFVHSRLTAVDRSEPRGPRCGCRLIRRRARRLLTRARRDVH